MLLVDTHCHLADPAYDADRGAVVERAQEAGVAHVVVIGESRAASDRACELARGRSALSASAGIHPHAASEWSSDTLAWLRERLAQPEVVAVGETGLDYHYDHSPRDAQRRAFEAQLILAAEAGKPAIIHAREADDDVAELLRAHPTARCILHSFSSGDALLETALDLGHFVSFSGMITFRNWGRDAAVRRVPHEALLVETDGPYLAPVPHRGQRNEPAFVALVADRLAAVIGCDAAEARRLTTRNAQRAFGSRLAANLTV
jgi:TatD DNase family protein